MYTAPAVSHTDPRARLSELSRERGSATRELRVGNDAIRLEGLDATLTEVLDRRWGALVGAAGSKPPAYTLTVYGAGREAWMDAPWKGGRYEIRAEGEGAARVVVSYHFALAPEDDVRCWRLGITEQEVEPLGRVLENATRYLVTRLALERGGFAIHGAGVLREGRAYLFAGPSRSGKSTAVRLSAPAINLGDDFAILLPGDEGWATSALPFDNAERFAHRPPEGLLPVAGMWRLFQAERHQTERPAPAAAIASLMACAAFPWALPDLAGELLDHVRQFVEDGMYAHLHFAQDPGFWTEILHR